MTDFNLNDIFKAYKKEKEQKQYEDKRKKSKNSLNSNIKFNREETNNQRLAIRKFSHVKK
jgi:hypothetical protein